MPKQFTDQYKMDVFNTWYAHGRPGTDSLYNFISDDPACDKKPTRNTLQMWIYDDFMDWAGDIDTQVKAQLDAHLVKEKVEMLSRHATVGQEMQDMSLNFLRANKDELNPQSAVRMLVEGVRIERSSRGIPEALDKMMNMSDQDLVDEIKKLITSPELTSGAVDEE